MVIFDGFSIAEEDLDYFVNSWDILLDKSPIPGGLGWSYF